MARQINVIFSARANSTWDIHYLQLKNTDTLVLFDDLSCFEIITKDLRHLYQKYISINSLFFGHFPIIFDRNVCCMKLEIVSFHLMKTNTYVFSEVGRWHLYLFNQVCVNLLVVWTKKCCFIGCDILCRFPIILALVEGSSTLVSYIQNNQ